MAGRDWRGIHRRAAAVTCGQMDRATYRRVANCRLRVSDEIREQPISAELHAQETWYAVSARLSASIARNS